MSSTGTSQQGNLDRYVVIHVATTCDEHGVYVTKDSAEVIELGWILLDAKTCDEVGIHSMYSSSRLLTELADSPRKCSCETHQYPHYTTVQYVPKQHPPIHATMNYTYSGSYKSASYVKLADIKLSSSELDNSNLGTRPQCWYFPRCDQSLRCICLRAFDHAATRILLRDT